MGKFKPIMSTIHQFNIIFKIQGTCMVNWHSQTQIIRVNRNTCNKSMKNVFSATDLREKWEGSSYFYMYIALLSQTIGYKNKYFFFKNETFILIFYIR